MHKLRSQPECFLTIDAVTQLIRPVMVNHWGDRWDQASYQQVTHS